MAKEMGQSEGLEALTTLNVDNAVSEGSAVSEADNAVSEGGAIACQ